MAFFRFQSGDALQREPILRRPVGNVFVMARFDHARLKEKSTPLLRKVKGIEGKKRMLPNSSCSQQQRPG